MRDQTKRSRKVRLVFAKVPQGILLFGIAFTSHDFRENFTTKTKSIENLVYSVLTSKLQAAGSLDREHAHRQLSD